MTILRARLAFAAVAACACAALAQETPASVYGVKDGAITYVVVHKLHQVRGTSRKLEGLAKIQPAGPTLVQVRVPLASFDSGNSNRDSHMREATHEAAHPYVEVKGTMPALKLPLGGSTEVPLDARVELNGESERQTIPVTLSPEGSGIRAKFSFPVSLDAHHVERPELLLVKVEDKVIVEGNLLFEARP
jgi:polyisoprenoid-binding protein YceI